MMLMRGSCGFKLYGRRLPCHISLVAGSQPFWTQATVNEGDLRCDSGAQFCELSIIFSFCFSDYVFGSGLSPCLGPRMGCPSRNRGGGRNIFYKASGWLRNHHGYFDRNGCVHGMVLG